MWNMFKGAISGHIQFLATGSSLKIMKNAFYFTLKYFFVLKIFKFLSLLFVVEKLILDPFLKNQNWAYLGINNSRFYTVCFHCMPSSRLSKYVENKLQIASFTSSKAFLKKQKGICN